MKPSGSATNLNGSGGIQINNGGVLHSPGNGGTVVALIGDPSACKSHLLNSYLTNKFSAEDVPEVFPPRTVVIPFSCSTVPLTITLLEADCREESESTRQVIYDRKISIFIAAFSVINPQSFERLITKWIPEINYHLPRVPFIIVGTKIDRRSDSRTLDRLRLKGESPITTQQGMELAKTTRAVKYMECSALTQQGVKELFDFAVEFATKQLPKKWENQRHQHDKILSEVEHAIAKHRVELSLKKRQITQLSIPRRLAEFKNLQTLDLSYNKLTGVPAAIFKLSHLKTLSIGHNKLTWIPKEIARLVSLTKLDLKYNLLNKLPTEMGEMTKLETLRIKGNPLKFIPEEAITKGTHTILAFLRDAMKDSERNYRMKLVLLGKEESGKTTLSHWLLHNRKPDDKPLSTDGIDIYNWTVPLDQLGSEIPTEALLKNNWQGKPLQFDVWDFAGQEIYSFTHQFFLTRRSVFVIAYSFIDKAILKGDYSRIEYWLGTLAASVRQDMNHDFGSRINLSSWIASSVVLVGTHADCVTPEFADKTASSILNSLSNFPIKHSFIVSCSTGRGIPSLKQTIFECAVKQKTMGQQIPKSYLELEQAVVEKRTELLQSTAIPVIPFHEFRLMAMKRYQFESDVELIKATEYLHECGLLAYFNDKRSGLCNIVVLDVKWLAEIMASIISTKTNFIEKGVLNHNFLSSLIWKGEKYPKSMHTILLGLLEKFGIAYRIHRKYKVYRATQDYNAPIQDQLSFKTGDKILLIKKTNQRWWTGITNGVQGFFSCSHVTESNEPPEKVFEEESLIPCYLSEKRPEEEINVFFQEQNFEFIIGRTWKFGFISNAFFPQLMVRIFHFTNPEIYWQTGFVVSHEAPAVCIVEFDATTKSITTRVMGPSLVAIDSMITLLSDELHALVSWIGAQLIETTVLCPHCLDNELNPQTFSMAACEEGFGKGVQTLDCFADNNTPVSVQIAAMAPDVALVKIPTIQYNKLEKIARLGAGAFAEVFQCKDTTTGRLLAVKELLDTSNLREFRQEVKFMSEMKHPNLVELVHICLQPLTINTEYLNAGTLTQFLKEEDTPYTWDLCLSLATDIANGMAFLHANKKIHLDLKSPNILVHRNDDGSYTAKVADFGLSRNLGLTIGGRLCDNPTWLAPEIMKNEEYTEKADVYSYGIILFELLTREFPFSNYHMLFHVELAVLEGQRPPIPSYCPPFLQKLMKQCWHEDPTKRPLFPDVLDVLVNKRGSFTARKTTARYKFQDFSIQANEILFFDTEDLAANMILLPDGTSLQQCTHHGIKVALPQTYLNSECQQLQFREIYAEITRIHILNLKRRNRSSTSTSQILNKISNEPKNAEYGFHRVENQGTLPMLAKKLNPTPKLISDSETVLNFELLQIDEAWNQSLNNWIYDNSLDQDHIEQKLKQIVEEHGKFFSTPISTASGVIAGTIKELGGLCSGQELAVGDRVIPMCSLAALPVSLTDLSVKIPEHPIESFLYFGQFKTTGTAIVFGKFKCWKIPEEADVPLMLLTADCLRKVSLTAMDPFLKNNRIVLIIGGGKEALLCLSYIRAKEMGVHILCLDDDDSRLAIIRNSKLCDVVNKIDLSNSQAVMEFIHQKSLYGADLVINLSNSPNTEATSIVSAREGGTVLICTPTISLEELHVAKEAAANDANIIFATGGLSQKNLNIAYDLLRDDPGLVSALENFKLPNSTQFPTSPSFNEMVNDGRLTSIVMPDYPPTPGTPTPTSTPTPTPSPSVSFAQAQSPSTQNTKSPTIIKRERSSTAPAPFVKRESSGALPSAIKGVARLGLTRVSSRVTFKN